MCIIFLRRVIFVQRTAGGCGGEVKREKEKKNANIILNVRDIIYLVPYLSSNSVDLDDYSS